MAKKNLIIIGIILVISCLGVGYFFYLKTQPTIYDRLQEAQIYFTKSTWSPTIDASHVQELKTMTMFKDAYFNLKDRGIHPEIYRVTAYLDPEYEMLWVIGYDASNQEHYVGYYHYS